MMGDVLFVIDLVFWVRLEVIWYLRRFALVAQSPRLLQVPGGGMS